MPASKDQKRGRATQREDRELRSSKREGQKERNGADYQIDPLNKNWPGGIEEAKRREQIKADGFVLKRIREVKTIVILLFS